MPTYQYRCTDCGERHEAVQSFTDPALTECPQCGGTLRKVFSSVGVVFKGSGFYRTDSRDKPDSAGAGDGKSERNEASKTGASEGDKTSTADKKSEKQSETKSDSGSSSSPSSPAKSTDASSAA